MYRVFESMDQLVNHLEQAMGVPMTSNCMVPRNEMLALLDEMRNAIPVELDDAQDVLDNQDEIIRSAEERASQTIADAERSEEHTSELQSRGHLVCRLLLEKKKNIITTIAHE